MRLIRFTFILTAIGTLAGCSSSPPPAEPAPAAETAAEAPKADAPKFVSVPELKELMAVKVEIDSETLWNISLDENAPKTAADWKKYEDAGARLAEAGKAMMTPALSKDEGPWKEESQKLVELGEAAVKAAKDRNKATIEELGAKMSDAVCLTCHKLYYTGIGG